MDPFDLLVALIVAVATVVGYRSGVLTQVLGLVGAALGVVVIVVGGPLVQPILDGYHQPLRALLALGAAFFVVAAGDAIGSTIGSVLAHGAQGTPFGILDRAGGAIFGVGQGIVIAWLVGGLVAGGPFPTLAREAQRSVAVRTILTVLPPPTDVLGNLGQLLDASGLPEVFIGLEPIPAPPVDLPGQAQADAIARPAIGSTVRIQSSACGKLLIGTGFEVRPGYVVTNAHVIAGADRSLVSLDGSPDRWQAVPVFFDPELDVALLRVAGLSVPSLILAAQAPPRGTVAAALGHPGGAALTVVPAAVTAEVQARGRDLYGSSIVVRSIIELQSAIRPGDSGGPLVLPDGTVGGLVFADSRTDPNVGYALDPAAVAADIQPYVGRAAPVGVGPCLP